MAIEDFDQAKYDEVTGEYKERHRELTADYYAEVLTKEEFDEQHGQLWLDYEAELVLLGIKPVTPEHTAIEADIEDLKRRVKELESL